MEVLEATRPPTRAETDDDDFDPFAAETEDAPPEQEGDDTVHGGEGDA